MPTSKKKSTPRKKAPPKPKALAAVARATGADPEIAAIQTRIQDALRKKFGAGSAVYLGAGEALAEVTEYIPTGLATLDHRVLGIGGLPVGRVVEVAGPPGSAKTTLGWQAVAAVQREGGVAVWGDAEKAASRNRCEVMGGRWEDLLLFQPDTIDEGLDQIRMTLELLDPGRGPNLIVYDSIPALPTVQEVKKGKPMIGDLARVLTTKLRRVGRLLIEKRTCLLAINQVRANIGFKKSGLRTPGGNYFEHSASVRLMLWPKSKVLLDGRVAGREIVCTAQKNRFTGPYQEVMLRLIFAKGWDDRWSTVELAKDEGLVAQKRHVGKRTHLDALKAFGWPSPAAAVEEAVEDVEEEEAYESVPIDEDDEDEDRPGYDDGNDDV